MTKVPFTQAQFVASAFKLEEMPRMLTSGGNLMPEIAIVGRSNVGKSSLINHLLNNSKLAKTSSTPGKTQSINFFSIDSQVALVDLPGYGYAKVPKAVKKFWAGFIDHYLQNRATLKLILFLIDSRRDPTEEDCALVKWASFHGKPMLLIFTKSDKLSDNEKREKTLASLDFMKNYLHSIPGGGCKTPRPGKIDDFEPVCQPAAEDILEKVDEAAGGQNDSKGRFCRGGEFYNSLPVHFLHYSIKDPRARIELIEKINVLLKEHGAHQ